MYPLKKGLILYVSLLIFILIPIFTFILPSSTIAQAPIPGQVRPPAPDCWYLGKTIPGSPRYGNGCSTADFGPIKAGTKSCVKTGPDTGNFCCSTVNATCNSITDLANSKYFYCCPIHVTSTPTPTPCARSATQQQCNAAGTAWVTVATNVCTACASCANVCETEGGTCIPTAPCVPPLVATSLSCGGSGVCCQAPTPTPTSTPTPIPTPACSSYNSCSSCTGASSCGWNGSTCQTGTSSSCPGGNDWYWYQSDCPSSQNLNRCSKFLIKGVVFNDKNNDGIPNGSDTVFNGTLNGAPYITTSDLDDNNIGTYNLNTVGYYETPSIYMNGSWYKILLNNIPSNCTSSRNPRSINISNADATENFPLTCTTPTPSSCDWSSLWTNSGSKRCCYDNGYSWIDDNKCPGELLSNPISLACGTTSHKYMVPGRDLDEELFFAFDSRRARLTLDIEDGTNSDHDLWVKDSVWSCPASATELCGTNSLGDATDYCPSSTGFKDLAAGNRCFAAKRWSNNTEAWFNVKLECSVTIQGHHVDKDGQDLSATSVPKNNRQRVNLNNGADGTTTSSPTWFFNNILPGTYTVTADNIPGFTTSYSECINSTDCPKRTSNTYTTGNSLSVDLPDSGNYADIFFKYTPNACQTTTSPSTFPLSIGGTDVVSASVTSGQGLATINQMRFGSYNKNIASVPEDGVPPSDQYIDTTSPYQATVTGVSGGTTDVWATAYLSDDRICQSSNSSPKTDTRVIVAGPTAIPTITPTPTRTPTPTSTPIPTNTPIPTSTPIPTPIPVYSISGKIFQDDGSHLAAGNPPYNGAITITRSPASGSFTKSGANYSFDNLPAGNYTIKYSGPLAGGFDFTYPPPSPIDRTFAVTVGSPGCSPAGVESTCSGGDIVNLNAGVTSTKAAWFQSVGSDLRWDSGFNNPLPSSDKYASIPRPTSVPGPNGMPGIIFSGKYSPTFGEGSASEIKNGQFNWKVGSPQNPEVFTDTHNLIPTSYRFLLETIENSGITPTPISTLDDFTPGKYIYKVDGDFNLSGSTYTFGSGNFIILINGNLNINREIKVPVGSTVIFSVSQDITVDKNVGKAVSSQESSLEGLYSADKKFIVNGNDNNCAGGADKRLNIAGSVIANAARVGGTFDNKRSLCSFNSSFPSVTFIERPDFILNYPSYVTQTTRTTQDVAP